jgi:acyl-CoA synthetase (NDP forming)
MKIDFGKLDRAFNPKCIVVVGDKGISNYRWLRQSMNTDANVYSVQIDPKEIEGIKALGVTNFASIMEVPEPVDLAIVAVPREVTPRILTDLIKKDVAAAHFFTAGFSESHTEKGEQLEKMLAEMSEKAKFHLIGPNCMGIMNPRAAAIAPGGMQAPPAIREPSDFTKGAVGLMSQSGMHGNTIGREALLQGVRVSKLVSYGNGTLLDSTDYLEYYGQDRSITAIGMYVEGFKDGKRFLSVLKDVSTRKPVVVWKGGRSETGARTISSHTNSLSAPKAVWEAAIRQCGGVNVYNVEQLIDVLQALQFLPPVTGDGVGLTGGTGGQGVAMTDAFTEAGMRIPPLTQKSIDTFNNTLTLIGGSYLNPIDTGNENRGKMKEILEVMEEDANLDNLVVLTGARGGAGPQFDTLVNALGEIRNRGRKPVMALMPLSPTPGEAEQAQTTMGKLQKVGIPAFFSIERGAFALRKAYEYHAMKKSIAAG